MLFQYQKQKNLETVCEPDNSAEGFWKRLHTAGFVLEVFSFNEYEEGNADLVTHEIITESSIIDNLRSSKHLTDDQEDDDDDSTL